MRWSEFRHPGDQGVTRSRMGSALTAVCRRGVRSLLMRVAWKLELTGLSCASQSAIAGISATVNPPQQACNISGCLLGSQRCNSASSRAHQRADGSKARSNKFAADSPLEGDGFELPVREHRAMAPSHGFAAASHREAPLRGAPASHGESAFRGAAGFSEARRRRAVHPSRNAVLRHRAGRPLSGREARRHAVRPLRDPARRSRHHSTGR
jgi:hypothetical protein